MFLKISLLMSKNVSANVFANFSANVTANVSANISEFIVHFALFKKSLPLFLIETSRPYRKIFCFLSINFKIYANPRLSKLISLLYFYYRNV